MDSLMVETVAIDTTVIEGLLGLIIAILFFVVAGMWAIKDEIKRFRELVRKRWHGF